MSKSVTIGIPVYKRLHCLPQALRSVAAQDYPNIDLLVSDNGLNGNKVQEIVTEWYSRPYRFRQNSVTVKMAEHYNQLIQEANGHYFMTLDDDDTISPNFVSDLVGIIEDHPHVAVASGRQHVVDASGRLLRQSSNEVSDFLTGEEFVRTWTKHGFANYTTFLTRTKDIKECGGFPDYPRGYHIEDAVLLKLCLGRSIAFSKRCIFYFSRLDSSMSASIGHEELAEATRGFLTFLDSDPRILNYQRSHPALWSELKDIMATMTWRTYLRHWESLDRQRLSTIQWVKAACVLPFIPDYYRGVISVLTREVKRVLISGIKKLIPGATSSIGF
jgi:glycosyltransferase involved in cell wall biosynthesis